MKGAQTVFLYRFHAIYEEQSWKCRIDEMDDKIPRLMEEELEESWMDLCPELDLTSPAIVAEVTARRNAHNNAQAALHAADNNHVVIPWN